MSDFQAIADRVEIEVLRGEFTDAVMMNDYDRVAALFTTPLAGSPPGPAGAPASHATQGQPPDIHRPEKEANVSNP